MGWCERQAAASGALNRIPPATAKRPALCGSLTFLRTKKGAGKPAHSFVPIPFISLFIILMKSHPAIVLATSLGNLRLSLGTGVILATSWRPTSQEKGRRSRQSRQQNKIKPIQINQLNNIKILLERLTGHTFPQSLTYRVSNGLHAHTQKTRQEPGLFVSTRTYWNSASLDRPFFSRISRKRLSAST